MHHKFSRHTYGRHHQHVKLFGKFPCASSGIRIPHTGFLHKYIIGSPLTYMYDRQPHTNGFVMPTARPCFPSMRTNHDPNSTLVEHDNFITKQVDLILQVWYSSKRLKPDCPLFASAFFNTNWVFIPLLLNLSHKLFWITDSLVLSLEKYQILARRSLFYSIHIFYGLLALPLHVHSNLLGRTNSSERTAGLAFSHVFP